MDAEQGFKQWQIGACGGIRLKNVPGLADRDDVGDAGERFRRVQARPWPDPPSWRSGEQVDAVELLGRPPDEGLLGPLPGAAETVTQNRTKNMRLGF